MKFEKVGFYPNYNNKIELGTLFSENKSLKKQDISLYNEIYKSIILEHAKNLYTPYDLLNYILELCNNYIPQSFVIKLDYKLILSLINKDTYKYYEQFMIAFNNIKDKENFNIFIAYINPQYDYDYNYFYRYFKLETTINYIKEVGKNIISKASCLNEKSFETNCFIILNKNKLSTFNYKKFETLIDHEINHYFELIDPDNNKVKHKININEKIKKIAYDLGYDLTNPDVKLHMIDYSEFNAMCADVCNNIENAHISYYQWLDMSTEEFLNNKKQFLNLSIDLQNSILFSFIVRCFDLNRWNKLKESVYVQLNNPTINILKSTKNLLKTWFLKIKF